MSLTLDTFYVFKGSELFLRHRLVFFVVFRGFMSHGEMKNDWKHGKVSVGGEEK
jgi:hypothetical protein